jgi:hypothetical protein
VHALEYALGCRLKSYRFTCIHPTLLDKPDHFAAVLTSRAAVIRQSTQTSKARGGKTGDDDRLLLSHGRELPLLLSGGIQKSALTVRRFQAARFAAVLID